MDLSILFEDKHILVAIKPAGVPSQKDRSRDMNMVTAVEEYLKSSNVGLVHRLDRPVEGIMVFAKTKVANANLAQQLQLKKMGKKYLAIVCGCPTEDEEILIDYLFKQRNNLSAVVKENTTGAKRAELKYKCLGTIPTEKWGVLSLLQIELITGRHHQIRVQLSNKGLPIWGDTKYNKNVNLLSTDWVNIALCAFSLSFNHPKTAERMSFKIDATGFPFNEFANRKDENEE